MSLVDQLQSLLSEYNLVAPLVLSALIAVGDWALRRWVTSRESRPSLSIGSNADRIVLTNHGKHPVEVLSASVTLRDVGSKPELAKKRHIGIGVAGLIQPGEAMALTEISGAIVEAVDEIWEPHRRQIEELGWSTNQPSLAHLSLSISCGVLGKQKRHSVVFPRHLLGSPTLGWHIQRSPYDPEYPDPLTTRAQRHLQTAWKWIRHPSSAYKAHQQFNFLGEQLTVRGLLRAMHEETITLEDGFHSLERVAKKANVDVPELLRRHIDLPDDVPTS